MMLPYVWPKGSWWRQIIVVACLAILGVGRGINVLVPIYSKYIGMLEPKYLGILKFYKYLWLFLLSTIAWLVTP